MRVPTVSPDARAAVLAWYDARGRTLPFRGQRDPYAILVSEVMAQQTQISRVAEQWATFMAAFPSRREPRRGSDRGRPARVARSRLQPARDQSPAGGARHRLGAWRTRSIQSRRAPPAPGCRALHGPRRCRAGIRAGGRAGRHERPSRPRQADGGRRHDERARSPIDCRSVCASGAAGGLDARVDGPWRDGLPPERAALRRMSRRVMVSIGEAGPAPKGARGCRRRHLCFDQPMAAWTNPRSAAGRARR